MANPNQSDTPDTNPNPQLPETRAPRPNRGGSATNRQNAAPVPPADGAQHLEPDEETVIVKQDELGDGDPHDEGARPAVAGSHTRTVVDRTQSTEHTVRSQVGHGGGGGNHATARHATPQPYDDFGNNGKSRAALWFGILATLVVGIIAIILVLTRDGVSKETAEEIAKTAVTNGTKDFAKKTDVPDIDQVTANNLKTALGALYDETGKRQFLTLDEKLAFAGLVEGDLKNADGSSKFLTPGEIFTKDAEGNEILTDRMAKGVDARIMLECDKQKQARAEQWQKWGKKGLEARINAAVDARLKLVQTTNVKVEGDQPKVAGGEPKGMTIVVKPNGKSSETVVLPRSTP